MEIGVGLLSWIWNVLKFYTCYLFHNGSDSILWRGGGFSTKAVYDISVIMDLRRVCVLCGREMETHEHLFFRCNYSRQCIRILKGTVRFTWPNRAWAVDIAWASKRWNGRHIVQAAYRALLAAIVYHIWQERNRRVFQQSMRPSSTIARIVVDEMSRR
ncbi:hypothetical protein Sango_3080100 [Sesamum angolense]|uniref:Reverse transcriptase zinc-binding domain-containing protein n=1 Tax=Sesamum angolense TaxID=2727404 RepID=A0AAE1TA26_9LAMI|nr:hypothetical protein Sango_3080100 [Sesamum angolense]